MFQTREISYDYKICIGWGEEQRRLRRRRLALASAAPVIVALMAGMASDHLSNHQFHLPPWDKPLVDQKPSPEKLLPIRTSSEAAIAYQAVLSELEPVSNPFTPRHIIEPAPSFPGGAEELATPPASLPEVPMAELASTETTVVEPTPSSDSDWQTVKVREGDNLASIFQRLGLSSHELDRIMGLGGDTATLKTLRPESSLRFRINAGSLSEMVHEINAAHTLHIRNQDGNYSAETVSEKLETKTVQASGIISSSLFEAGQSAGLSDTAIMNLANIFDFDIDLALDIREGDRFTVVYEEVYKDGKKIKDGNILAAEFINKGETFRAVRYEDKQGGADYYRPDGRALRRAFIRTPVAFTRITSKFGLRRHPILNRIRNHKGVDYAAPIGTPVKATGDAKVAFAGWQGGYGRVVQLQHEGHYMTVYGHLSRFAACAKVGQRVRLGEVIGYVGMSGLATGPHLHYEFRVKGVHRDPLTVKLPQAFPIARNRLADFKAKTQPSMALLDNASTLAAAASGKQQASSDPNSTGATQVVASATAH